MSASPVTVSIALIKIASPPFQAVIFIAILIRASHTDDASVFAITDRGLFPLACRLEGRLFRIGLVRFMTANDATRDSTDLTVSRN
jgi:hypothetical protein